MANNKAGFGRNISKAGEMTSRPLFRNLVLNNIKSFIYKMFYFSTEVLKNKLSVPNRTSCWYSPLGLLSLYGVTL